MIEKLCLGTAQFGMDYGIANKTGKISKQEAFEILDYSYNSGIKAMDTASSYGDSEEIIGEFLGSNSCDFDIISKLPPLDEFNSKDVGKILHESLVKLNRKSIHAYLIHRIDDFLKYGSLWGTLEGLKEKYFIKKIGFSIYRPQELQTIFERGIDFDIIQVPYSIFDRRFESYFGILKKKGIEIHVRSIFLQGLVYLKPDELPDGLSAARGHVARIRDLASEYNISINALCLDFALLNSYINKVILGVDSLEHLKTAVEKIGETAKIRNFRNELDKLSIENEDIILPYKWRL